jgi:diguanylate cyclase (GGDEF)-like protein
MALGDLLELENHILRMIARGAPLVDTARHICKAMEACLPGVLCEIEIIDADGQLRPLALGDPRDEASLSVARPTAEGSVPSFSASNWSSLITGETGTPIGRLTLLSEAPGGAVEIPENLAATCVEWCELAFRRHEHAVSRDRRATLDVLTGLLNRAAFDAELANLSCEEPGSWAVLMIDLDNLKVVNDVFGHAAGDALIRVAASRIAAAMSPNVTFRFGGDEFAVIVREPATLANIEGGAGRIFDALEELADCAGNMVAPAATIGGAVLAAGDIDGSSVCQNADFALYHAKETGRGGFVRYWPGIDTRITHRIGAIHSVSAAIADDRISAYYQPIVQLDNFEIIGVEALCRLKRHDGEILSAYAFREATSDVRVATALTDRMLSIAAGDVRRWLDEDIPLRFVSVNVSAADFYAGDLLRKLDGSFGRARVPLDHLIVEVNEDVWMGRNDRIVAREVKRLRENGVRVALDNFGSGQAPLTHLMNVPVDAIKIDRSLIAELWPNEPSTAIVKGVIEIAHELGIQVIAEGIEAEVEASQLWTMGCEFGQGFVFSRPMGAAEMAALLRRHLNGIIGAVPLRLQTGTGFQGFAQDERRTGTI